MNVELIGTLGAIFSCSAILPQIYKSYKTKSTEDLSWYMFFLFYIGVAFNITFGILIDHPAIYIAGVYSFVTNTTLATMKLYYDKLCKWKKLNNIELING